MSFFSIVKFSLWIIVLMGAELLLVGIGKVWTAYDFYSHSKPVSGVFKGYHTEKHLENFRDSNGYTSYRNVSEDFPMFVYRDDSGKNQLVTAEESHFFPYLDYDDPITVLVRTDRSETPRLGGFIDLYGSALIMMVFAGIFIVLPLKAINFTKHWLSSQHDHDRGIPQEQLRERLDSPVNITDLWLYIAILLALFVVGAGAMWYFTLPGNDKENPAPSPLAADPHVQEPIKPAVYQQLGSEQLYQAARLGDHETVTRLLAKGEHIYDIRPAVVQSLIRKNDVAMLKLIFADGFDLSQHYARQTFGDQAVAEGRSEIVKLIRSYQGVFEAPPIFVALAAEDLETLKSLKAEADPTIRFRGMTLKAYAKRYRKETLLEQISD